jgi:predicted TIM-barrel fold metal-dependent hydrolase
MHGLKLHPDFQRFNVDDPEVFKIYRAVDARVPILFHAGDDRYTYSAPERIATVAKTFPKQAIIAAHFGGYRCWDRLDAYLGLDNVYFDTCSSLEYLTPAEATAIIQRFGAEKFMFATDFPMWDHEEELAKFMRLGLTDDQKEMILGANAKRLLKL